MVAFVSEMAEPRYSAVLENADLVQSHQVFVDRYQRKIEYLCGSRKKMIGRITVEKVYRGDGKRHLNR